MICDTIKCEDHRDKIKLTYMVMTKGYKYYYVGVECPKCRWTHRISRIYTDIDIAVEQVKLHNKRLYPNGI